MRDNDLRIIVIAIMAGVLVLHCIVRKRVTAIERIVGFETPASASWTNGHTYMTVVKHSANCPCVIK